MHFIIFYTNVIKKRDEFSDKDELSDSLQESFSNILTYQFKPKKEENAEETLCLLLRLKSRSARGVSPHPAFMVNCPTISHTCKPCIPSR